jgi:hypothetical protein
MSETKPQLLSVKLSKPNTMLKVTRLMLRPAGLRAEADQRLPEVAEI